MEEMLSNPRRIKLIVNRRIVELEVETEVYATHTLARTLRETLGLTGTKIGCNHGECGACTVLMDGEPICSCMVLTVECDGKNITTIEELRDAQTGKLHPVQRAFIEGFGLQCGFCTPGMIMSTKALLDQRPSPAEEEIKEALSGNLCRCGNYPDIVGSVHLAARWMKGE